MKIKPDLYLKGVFMGIAEIIPGVSGGTIAFITGIYEELIDSIKSINTKTHLVYVLKFKNRIGNPIGFNISLLKKFKNIKGKFGAKFMVKRLKNKTKFIKINSAKSFKDFDKVSDFRV